MTNRYPLPRQMTGQTHRPPPVRLYTPPTEGDPLPKPPPLTIWPDLPADKSTAPEIPAEQPEMPALWPAPTIPAKVSALLDDPDRVVLWLLILLLIRNNASLELILALCYVAM